LGDRLKTLAHIHLGSDSSPLLAFAELRLEFVDLFTVQSFVEVESIPNLDDNEF